MDPLPGKAAPRTSFQLTPWRLARAMDDGHHIYPIGPDAVDDAIRPFKHFSEILPLKLRHHATRARERADLHGPPGEAIHDAPGIDRRVLRDVFVDATKLT
jgi:hypothetical protein